MNSKFRTWSLSLQTAHSYTLNPKPETLDPKTYPYTLIPTP